MSAVPEPIRVSLKDYLATNYRPDCDYIDGEIEERNVGEFDHSFLQGLLFRLFYDNRETWRTRVSPEQRVRLGSRKVRVPDVCVMRSESPKEQVVTHPPLICIEILSPKDTLRKMQQRVDDYFDFRTEHVWIIDPGLRKGYVCSRTGLQEPDGGVFLVPGTPIRVVLSELFAELDRA
ncbi:MAG TPA: Uma2 family endonuclease [Acidobacteriaceae bacterium]|nr:Uma2 family endonuclease [Acidobacteriaceae bacterium]